MLYLQVGRKIWIVDLGPSDHMVFDKSLLHNIRSVNDLTLITLPRISQCGGLRIDNSLTLHNALFVPYFQFNLLSIKRLSEQL